MTIGENIKYYRKKFGLSQEELGQKLIVSRQTISLWEKNQTVPTIDNLIRLKEIFGVSIDEIFGVEQCVNNEKETPSEIYNYNFSSDELLNIYKYSRNVFLKRPIIFVIVNLALFLFMIGSEAPVILIGFIIGNIFTGVVYHSKSVTAYKKTWKTGLNKVAERCYEYQVYNNYFTITIRKNDEIIRTSKVYFSEIEHIHDTEKYLLFVIGGQNFILRKSNLSNNSAFYSYLKSNPSRVSYQNNVNAMTVLSTVFFIASLLSIFGALALIALISSKNHLFVENTWLFFLLTPIPITSILFGFLLKKKGYKYKKNIVVGSIMTALLCIYGSFSFIFADLYNHGPEPIINFEQMTGIDLPEYKQINTQDFTKGIQSVSRGYIYYTSDVYFDEEHVEQFEKKLKTEKRWLSSMPNDLIGITSPFNDYSIYDYMLIYNIDTSEYNTLPKSNGTYRFINILYRTADNQMKIAEYDIEYKK